MGVVRMMRDGCGASCECGRRLRGGGKLGGLRGSRGGQALPMNKLSLPPCLVCSEHTSESKFTSPHHRGGKEGYTKTNSESSFALGVGFGMMFCSEDALRFQLRT